MTAEEYLKEHGITEKTVKEFNLTWDENYLYIPIKDEEGNEIAIKSRNLKDNGEPKYKNSGGSHAVLFNYHAVKDSPNMILCEGEVDCMRLQQDGLPTTTSTGGANTFLEEWAEQLKEKNVWIILDNDQAGKNGTRKILELLPQAKAVTLEDAKDVSEYLQTHTKADLAKLMRNAQTKEEWENSNSPEEYTLLTAKDYEEMEEDKMPWLIENIIYPEGFCFIYGAEGTGKSFLTLEMAKAVATGELFLDHFPTTKANVLFLDKENPHSITKKRIAGLGINSQDTPNIYWLKYPEKFSLAGSKGGYSDFAQALANTIRDKQIGMIVFDSFVDFMVGNESSPGDTQLFFDAIRALYPKIAYVTLHHENKPSQGTIRNDSQRLRGSSNISAQTITMFRLEAVPKSKTEMTLKQTKNRDAQRLNKFLIRMLVNSNDDGSTSVNGFEYVGDVENDEEDTKTDEAVATIFEILNANNGSMSKKDLLENASGKGVANRTIERAIKNMVDNQELNKFKKGKEVWLLLERPIVNSDEIFGDLGY